MKRINMSTHFRGVKAINVLGLFLLFAITPVALAICLQPDTFFYRHFPQGDPNIYYSGIVNYSFENIPDGIQKTQIEAALNIWNASLVNSCSFINLAPGPGGELGGATLIIKNGPIPNYGAARAEETYTYGNEIIEATLIFNPDLLLPSGGQMILFYDPNVIGYSTIYTKNTLHEIGHFLGMNHYNAAHPNGCLDQIPVSSVMNDGCGVNDNANYISLFPTSCDYAQLNSVYVCPTPSPTATPTPIPLPIGYCNGGPDFGTYPSGCAPGFVYSGGVCTRSSAFQNQCNRFGFYEDTSCSCSGGCAESGSCSPIVIDTTGNGFDLTNAANGVDFDIRGFGVPERIGWTTANSDDGWLAMDRDGNGVIDNGMELFGTATPQPSAPEKNGFLALAEYDKVANGGNSDGVVNKQDTVFSLLRIWLDSNHNGISEPGELHSLSSLGIKKLELDYKVSGRIDQFGNQFRWRAKVKDKNDAQIGRWAWDVIPVHQ